MRSFVFTGLTLPLAATVALAQTTTPLVPAPPLTPLPTTPTPAPPSTSGGNEPPVDYPGAIWTPAAEGNYDVENRPAEEPIDMVIVHDIEGPETSGISIFQTKGRSASSHYIVGGDGKVYQLVREKNVAWHAGNRSVNHRSIGIETHGYAYRPGWYNFTIYEAEAKLIRSITTRYNIPRDRSHIIGHFEVPDPSDPTKFGGRSGHTDPGPFWDWDSFMLLIRNDAKLVSASVPPLIHPGEILPASVTMQNTGDDVWFANTSTSIYNIKSNGPVTYFSTKAGTPSPLFNLRGWVSPLVAAQVRDRDVAPGSSTAYSFTITGPMQLGSYTESMRVSRFPKMGEGGRPVSFGDTVSISTQVVPYDITVPAPDAPATPLATSPSTPNPIAMWTPKLPVDGIYAMYVAPSKPRKVRKNEVFRYQLTSKDGPVSAAVESKFGGQGYAFAGYYNFATKNPLPFALTQAPKGITAATAGSLRFVGPFPTVPTTAAPTVEALIASTGATGSVPAAAPAPTVGDS